ncbi:ABC transporter substrate-binding protein [Hydrogenophaga sp. NFH-34]|uniref:ABC transporter substrate-binding protein n=1 Tax=Hydrogenophaga sp. NFH-34 TaxID=2744446 RepID=UPI001F364A80|nr:ABC transporter substrate-binding protein [Hydrogenophaga sp. NFH-34]
MLNRRQLMAIAALALAVPTVTQAQNPSDIVVAQIGPFTGLPAPDALWLNEGMNAAFNEINAAGGIGNRKVRLLKFDDGYTYEGFKERMQEAMASNPVALLAPVGSATIKGVLDNALLDRSNIMILNAVPGASVLRSPGHPRLFHIRAGDDQQVKKVIDHGYAMTTASMGVLFQDIPIGSSGLESAKAAVLAGGGKMDLVEIQSSLDSDTLKAAAKKMASVSPQAALVIGNPKFMAEGVTALRKAGMRQPIFALSYLPATVLFKQAAEHARGVGIVQTFPSPQGVSTPIQRNFRMAMKKSFPEMDSYSPFHIEGYITARVFIEAASRAKSISSSDIASALRQAGEIDLGGYRVNFSKGNEGSKWVDIGVVSHDGRLRY